MLRILLIAQVCLLAILIIRRAPLFWFAAAVAGCAIESWLFDPARPALYYACELVTVPLRVLAALEAARIVDCHWIRAGALFLALGAAISAFPDFCPVEYLWPWMQAIRQALWPALTAFLAVAAVHLGTMDSRPSLRWCHLVIWTLYCGIRSAANLIPIASGSQWRRALLWIAAGNLACYLVWLVIWASPERKTYRVQQHTDRNYCRRPA